MRARALLMDARRLPWLAAALLAAVLTVAAAPASAQGLFDDTEARRRIEVLRQQIEANQRSLEERFSKIEGASADRSALLELSTQIASLREEVQRLRGQVEVLSHQSELAEKRQKDLYLDIDTRLRKLEEAGEKSASAAPGTPGAPGAGEPSAAENRAYQAALDQFKLGNYPLAVSAMQGFLVTYPSSPLAPNAQYWIGMAYSGQRNYKEAINAQRKVLAAWPQSDKAPDALLSIASSQETMGDRGAARKSLEELVAKYPTSSAAASAKQRLAILQKR
jgi:tol-pal system protein YbgF